MESSREGHKHDAIIFNAFNSEGLYHEKSIFVVRECRVILYKALGDSFIPIFFETAGSRRAAR